MIPLINEKFIWKIDLLNIFTCIITFLDKNKLEMRDYKKEWIWTEIILENWKKISLIEYIDKHRDKNNYTLWLKSYFEIFPESKEKYSEEYKKYLKLSKNK